jgi:hypothetical protein
VRRICSLPLITSATQARVAKVNITLRGKLIGIVDFRERKDRSENTVITKEAVAPRNHFCYKSLTISIRPTGAQSGRTTLR